MDEKQILPVKDKVFVYWSMGNADMRVFPSHMNLCALSGSVYGNKSFTIAASWFNTSVEEAMLAYYFRTEVLLWFFDDKLPKRKRLDKQKDYRDFIENYWGEQAEASELHYPHRKDTPVPPSQYNPPISTPPGATIQELLTEKFEEQTGLSYGEGEKLFCGELPIDQELAQKLEDLFNVPVKFWLSREQKYRERLNTICS